MKAKNILMTLLLVTGAIAARATGYPAELALVSQPVMVYNHSSITVYYDVENIGDYTYRGDICIFLDPDYGYSYAEKYVKVRPGRIKRIAIDIPVGRINPGRPFTIMPYYEMGRELYSFTTFEYFEPVRFFWNGPRNEPWVVIHIGPCVRYYHRPGTYRYYYDGHRPPMPPAGPNTPPPPIDPSHHTYNYHHENGYPGGHGNTPPPANGGSHEAPNATVRPKANAGSMSSGNGNSGNTAGSVTSSNTPKPNNGGSNSGRVRPKANSSNSGSVRPKTNNGSSARPSGSSSNSGRTGNSNSRVNSSSSSNARPSATSNSATRNSGNSSANRSNNTSSRSGGSSSRR